MFTLGERGRNKKTPNSRDEKEFPGENLKQVIMGKHKTYKEWKRDTD